MAHRTFSSHLEKCSCERSKGIYPLVKADPGEANPLSAPLCPTPCMYGEVKGKSARARGIPSAHASLSLRHEGGEIREDDGRSYSPLNSSSPSLRDLPLLPLLCSEVAASLISFLPTPKQVLLYQNSVLWFWTTSLHPQWRQPNLHES